MNGSFSKTAFVGALVSAGLCVTAAAAPPWVGGPPLNHPRGFTASVVDHCGNILVFGGMQRFSSAWPYYTLGSVEVLSFNGQSYSPSWTMLGSTMPVERQMHTAVFANGFVYVLGGYRLGPNPVDVEPILQVDRYDLLTGQWDSSTVPPIPSPTICHTSIVDRIGRIWMIGGEVPNVPNVRSEAILFDPARPQLGWQTMPSLNTARSFARAIVDNAGRIRVIGGLSQGHAAQLDTVEMLDPCSGGGWVVLPGRLPHQGSQAPIEGQATLGADGYIYVTGGWANNNYSSAVSRIDSRDPLGSWSPWMSLGLARSEHTSVLGRDGRIYIIGGEAAGVVSQTNVETLYTGQCLGDLNADRVVDSSDLGTLLGNWQAICP
ncbi:MAG: hypothetical protein U1D55_05850 [Phycisphaerae bacterium]